MGTTWDQTLEKWQWVIGVNLWGVIHGIRTFVPIMLQQGTEGHIVNTASMLAIFLLHSCRSMTQQSLPS